LTPPRRPAYPGAAYPQHPAEFLTADPVFSGGKKGNNAPGLGNIPDSAPTEKIGFIDLQGIRRPPNEVVQVLPRPAESRVVSPQAFYKIAVSQDSLVGGLDSFTHKFSHPLYSTTDQFISPAVQDAVLDEHSIPYPRRPCGSPEESQYRVRILRRKSAISHQDAVPTPGIMVKRSHVFDETGAKGVEMNVTHQLEQIGFFLADDGFITVLKEVPGAAVAAVERDRVAGQQSAHERT
jgi:hypothetical protein